MVYLNSAWESDKPSCNPLRMDDLATPSQSPQNLIPTAPWPLLVQNTFHCALPTHARSVAGSGWCEEDCLPLTCAVCLRSLPKALPPLCLCMLWPPSVL